MWASRSRRYSYQSIGVFKRLAMRGLENLIDVLNERAADSDLLALLGTSREVRLHNAALARELRDVVKALRREMENRKVPALRESNEIRIDLQNIDRQSCRPTPVAVGERQK